MDAEQSFRSPGNFADRLGRDFSGRFGSDAYAFEELIAEMGSAFLCASCRVDGALQHTEYLASWLKVLKADKYAIFTAARESQKAASYLLERAGLGDAPGAPVAPPAAAQAA